ncbi:carbon-nitrogen hydrolase family protein [Stetteria hydrogenophila]
MPLVRVGVAFQRVRLNSSRINGKRLAEALEALANEPPGIDLFITPPYPLTGPIIGYHSESKARSYLKSSAERLSDRGSLSGKTMSLASRLAESYRVNIISGPIIERAGPRLYVTSFAVNSSGALAGKYRKLAVTRKEMEYGISPGREAGVFELAGLRVGVFIDEDLAVPEIFRVLQARRVNLVVGFMLPYESDYIPSRVRDAPSIPTMDLDEVSAFLRVVARLTGVPILLVGGAVEGVNGHDDVAFMPTLIAEADLGVRVMRDYDDLGRPVQLEVNTESSVARPLDLGYEAAVAHLCRLRAKRKG